MLIRYTRTTALLRRTQSLSFLLLQAKLRIWPLLIYDSCIPQTHHAHTYSNTKNALKTGIRNIKENINKGIKTDLVLYLFVLVINMFFFGLQTVCFDL